MAPVVLINGEFVQVKQHHTYLVMMSDDRLKRDEFIDSVCDNSHTQARCVQETGSGR